MSWRGARTTALIVVAALVLAASFHDNGDSSDDAVTEPSIGINVPDSGEVLVREASFEIGGDFGGSVDTIDVSIDGAPAGPATRGEPGEWRFGAGRFSITPGLHEITAVATGGGGTTEDQLWVYYEPDRGVGFRVAVVPEEATYPPDELVPASPRLLLFGPGFGDQIPLQLTVSATPPLTASISSERFTGSLAFVEIAFDDPPPGVYPIVATAVSEEGEVQEATHTVTISGPPPPSQPDEPPEDTPEPEEIPPDADSTVVLSDDFEGPDRWSATVTRSTNGAEGSAELAGGGNPGGQRRMVHVLPGTDDGEANPTQITVVHTFTGAGWDPAVDGPLDQVNYSEDQIEYEPPFEGAAVGTQLVVVQGDTTYTAPVIEGNAFSNTAWQTVRVRSLAPADFSPAPGPDFSADGAPMTFGYVRSNTSRSSTPITIQHGIDNWTVELVRSQPSS